MRTYKAGYARFIAMTLAILITVSLSGCGSKDETIDSVTAQAAQTEEPAEGTFTSDLATTTSTPEPTEVVEEIPEGVEGLTSSQRESINMLNHMTVMTTQVNDAKRDRLFLESAYSFFVNDIYPNVDVETQAQVFNLMDTIHKFRMIDVKWDRLEYIYEQNRAQALRQSIPNPVGLLSVVQSGNILKSAISVIYMTVDASMKYASAVSNAEMEYLKGGWELEDAEKDELHNSTKNALGYIFSMSRKYGFPGEYVLREDTVKSFIEHADKPDSQLTQKIDWFENHVDTYGAFGPYWLELAKDYYNDKQYGKCLQAVSKYEAVTSRISLKDTDYASILPMAIVSARETMEESEYCVVAERYCEAILKNIKDADWNLRYFVARTYTDLYLITKNIAYLDNAYYAAKNNILNLVDEQRALNDAYLKKLEEAVAEKGATKRKIEEVKQYNNLAKERRKTALPPVSEALYLNCDLIFEIKELHELPEDPTRLNNTLHENGDSIFLTQALDNKFWLTNHDIEFDVDSIDVSFDGKTLTIPAVCVSDRSIISATVNNSKGTTILGEWYVTNVDRHKSEIVSDFTATFESKPAKEYKYQAGDTVTITVIPVAEDKKNFIEFNYNVIATKSLVVFDSVGFERVTK